MPFNPDKFERAQFEARTKAVEVKALADFFDEGTEPVWTVRGLSSNELHRSIEAGQRQKTLGKVLESIADAGAPVADARRALGFTGKETQGEVAKRLEMLAIASVEPVIPLNLAVKLAENFPIEFYQLTNEITELTGMGFELVKPQAALPKMTA